MTLSPTRAVSCRVDFRAVIAGAVSAYTGRLESLSASGCTIRTGQHLTAWDALELSIYLPGLTSVLQINQAKVTWACSNAFRVEFVALAVAEEDFVVDATGDSPPFTCPMTTRRPV